MGRCCGALLASWLCVTVCGCESGKPPARAEDLVGKWRLVRADGQTPAALGFKSLRIDVAADGTWTSDIQMHGQLAGVSMKGGGKWSLADGIVSYTSGANSGKSRPLLRSGGLVLNPDFTVRVDGTEEVTGEYERDR